MPRVSKTIDAEQTPVTAVPLLDLHRQYKTIREEILAAVERVCDSQQFVLGPEVEALEAEIAAYTGSAAAVGCASGTDALWLALVATGVGPGDSVITTPFSFFASASAIVRAGARPIFVDVCADTLNLNPELVEAKLRDSHSCKAKAILPVHLYGQCSDMTAFARISQEFGVPVVEDAAQALGASWDGKPAGSLGVAAALSFYPTKNLNAYGDAGMVTTQNVEMAEHMRRLRNHGSSRRYHHHEMGWNARMDAIQAAILRVKLPHLKQWNDRRREHAATYDRLLTESGLTKPNDSGSPAIKLPVAFPQAHHIYHQYVIRSQRRDELRAHLAERSIETEIYYPIPLHLQPCFAYLGYREGCLSIAEHSSREALALPIFPELEKDELDLVVEAMVNFFS